MVSSSPDTPQKEAFIALRCDDFEVDLSEYIEGELSTEKTERMAEHVLACPACSITLRGVLQVRRALYGLSEINPSAAFKLHLSSFLQEKMVGKRRLWVRSLAVGLAFAVALAILLWPEQHDELPEHLSWEQQEPLANRQLGRVWIERFPELSRPGPRSLAHMRTVSF